MAGVHEGWLSLPVLGKPAVCYCRTRREARRKEMCRKQSFAKVSGCPKCSTCHAKGSLKTRNTFHNPRSRFAHRLRFSKYHTNAAAAPASDNINAAQKP